MNETNLSARQKQILNLIGSSHNGLSRATLEKALANLFPASKATIARDLLTLTKAGLLQSIGKGKQTVYRSIDANPILRYFDLSAYFTLEPDQRTTARKTLNFAIFPQLTNLFPLEEKRALEKMSRNFSAELSKAGPDIARKELERFTIELSWKSSKIEGNTYTLLDTEALIKERNEASGHPKQEAIMILNHKAAFETILAHKQEFRKLTLSSLTQLHNVLVKDLSITTGIRAQPVGITGTAHRPPDNSWQIKEALEKTLAMVNQSPFPLEKALLVSALIPYIQPFADGNKRTGRMLTNAILLSHDIFPLSYRSIDETIYKEALILFFEQNSLYHLKKIVVEQYRFALQNYFPMADTGSS